MNRQIIQTEDGSSSIFVPELNENYHSTHGAIQESCHVFLKKGLHHVDKATVNVFEVGFGTGLNALLTFFEAQKLNISVHYHSIEKYPVNFEEAKLLNYPDLLDEQNAAAVFQQLHQSEWNKDVKISDHFTLRKIEGDLKSVQLTGAYDLVYFDAFAPNKQENMWSEEIFKKLFDAMENGGFLVTYCAKGSVRRTLISAGFEVERTDGPPGKREMLRACKC